MQLSLLLLQLLDLRLQFAREHHIVQFCMFADLIGQFIELVFEVFAI